MTELGRNLKKVLDESEKETGNEVRRKLWDYNKKIEESLHEVKGFGVISKDTALVQEAYMFVYKQGYLNAANDLFSLLTRTWTWENAGIPGTSGENPHYPHAILAGLHDDRPAGIWPYIHIVERLAYLINDAEELNELSKMGVPCKWHKIRNDMKASVEYWIGQGKLSLELVKRAAESVRGTGYDSGLESWQN